MTKNYSSSCGITRRSVLVFSEKSQLVNSNEYLLDTNKVLEDSNNILLHSGYKSFYIAYEFMGGSTIFTSWEMQRRTLGGVSPSSNEVNTKAQGHLRFFFVFFFAPEELIFPLRFSTLLQFN